MRSKNLNIIFIISDILLLLVIIMIVQVTKPNFMTTTISDREIVSTQTHRHLPTTAAVVTTKSNTDLIIGVAVGALFLISLSTILVIGCILWTKIKSKKHKQNSARNIVKPTQEPFEGQY